MDRRDLHGHPARRPLPDPLGPLDRRDRNGPLPLHVPPLLHPGAKLTRTGIVASRIALLATTCATCGSVKVYLGSTLLKTVSLYSATTVYRKLISVKSWRSAHKGTLTIKVASSGKKVIIDGVVIRRVW